MDNLQLNMNGQNPEIKKMNAFQRIIGVFFSPAETMKNVAEKPTILIPLMLAVITPVVVLLLRYDTFIEWLRQYTIESTAQSSTQVTAEMLDAQMKFIGPFTLVTSVIWIVISWLVGTAILFGIIRAFKGEGMFKQFLSVTAYAGVIMVLSYLVMGVVSALTGVLDLKSPVTSLGSLLPDSMKSGFLYGMLASVELFSIWQYIVIAIGVIQVSKLDKKKVYGIIGGIYAVIVLFAGVSQLFAGLYQK